MKTAPLTKILNVFLEAMKKSQGIKGFCRDKYGKDPLFFIGMDYNQPPKEEDCPYIVIVPGDKREGLTDLLEYKIHIAWAITNPSTKTCENVICYLGVEEADTFGQLIIKAVSGSLDNAVIHEADYILDTITQYPQFPGELDLTVKVPNTIGGDIEF